MNPKISDFGLARIFGVDQTQGNTSRIVRTYGYMSLEYAMHRQFSVKSNVYSFGVIALETITGKKNNNFYQTDGARDLLSYVSINKIIYFDISKLGSIEGWNTLAVVGFKSYRFILKR
ncbi:hypothetical protein WN943_014474 [Citrus x changshan-huyou]